MVGRDQPAVPTNRAALIGAVGLVVGVAAVVALASRDVDPYIVQALVVATVALSLVVLTGLSGQVSLAQYLFVGVGVFVTGKTFDGGSVLGMLLGGLVAAVISLLVAIPAVRLRGLHLALTTFGVALIGREAILGDDQVFGRFGVNVDRPTVLGLQLSRTPPSRSGALWCSPCWPWGCVRYDGAHSVAGSPRSATASSLPARSDCGSAR